MWDVERIVNGFSCTRLTEDGWKIYEQHVDVSSWSNILLVEYPLNLYISNTQLQSFHVHRISSCSQNQFKITESVHFHRINSRSQNQFNTELNQTDTKSDWYDSLFYMYIYIYLILICIYIYI